jgi:hypothetical protein
MRTFTLDDFIPSRENKPRRIYERMKPTVTTTRNPTVLEVNLEWLREALCGDPIWAMTESDRDEQTFVMGKYLHHVAAIQRGDEIAMPWLNFEQGRTAITDGRHRLYAMADLGYTHCKVVVSNGALWAIKTLVDDSSEPAFAGRSPSAIQLLEETRDFLCITASPARRSLDERACVDLLSRVCEYLDQLGEEE